MPTSMITYWHLSPDLTDLNPVFIQFFFCGKIEFIEWYREVLLELKVESEYSSSRIFCLLLINCMFLVMKNYPSAFSPPPPKKNNKKRAPYYCPNHWICSFNNFKIT